MTHLSARHIRKCIERMGGKVTHIRFSRHVHVTFDYFGHICKSVFSVSPSDTDWELRKHADLKRELKARGIWRRSR